MFLKCHWFLYLPNGQKLWSVHACMFVSIPVSFFIFLERHKAMSFYQILYFQLNTVEFPVASPLLYLWLLISSKKQDANKLKILTFSTSSFNHWVSVGHGCTSLTLHIASLALWLCILMEFLALILQDIGQWLILHTSLHCCHFFCVLSKSFEVNLTIKRFLCSQINSLLCCFFFHGKQGFNLVASCFHSVV